MGARRHRQGLGPFVARWLREAGAEVPAFFCTSAASVAEAGEQLRRVAGLDARGHHEPAAFLDEELDGLAILSPAGHHRVWLERALEARLDVLCEKPLVWGDEAEGTAARELVTAFGEQGLLLLENAQWPATLPAFHALHPDAAGEPLRRFAMRMAPASVGVDMIGDALSHPLSVLQALRPAATARVEEPRFSTHHPAATELSVHFRWVAEGALEPDPADPLAWPAGGAEPGPVALAREGEERSVEVLVELSASPGQPREASLAVNDRWAHRLIRTRDYALFFASGATLVDVPDPLALHLERFVAALRRDRPRGSAAENTRIVQRLEALDTLRRAFHRDTA